MFGRRRKDDPFAGFTGVSEIGRGAIATVFRAVETTSGQPVAIKVLHGADVRDLENRALQAEARTLGAIGAHPHVVTMHRAERRGDGTPMLIMELCAGSLAERVATTGPLPVREVVAIAVKLAGALETAHRAGILHGDLKPANVLATAWGEPVLADFGMASLREVPSGRTHPSGSTAHHGAPEVLLGADATTASDVYGLGSLVFELLAGTPPFLITPDEDPVDVQRRIISDPPPRLVAPDVGPTLRALVRRAMAKEPRDRPVSALAFAEELRTFEVERGWDPTPYRIDSAEPVPPRRPKPGPTSSRRSADEHGRLPHLGLPVRPFDDVVPDERRLEPVSAHDHDLLPGRAAPLLGPADAVPDTASGTANGPPTDEAATVDPPTDAPIDLGYRWRVDEPPPP